MAIDHEDTIVNAARPLASIMIDPDVPESIKHHLHEAIHHLTVAVLQLDAHANQYEEIRT